MIKVSPNMSQKPESLTQPDAKKSNAISLARMENSQVFAQITASYFYMCTYECHAGVYICKRYTGAYQRIVSVCAECQSGQTWDLRCFIHFLHFVHCLVSGFIAFHVLRLVNTDKISHAEVKQLEEPG